jgi:two-component system, NtrC family, response regulator
LLSAATILVVDDDRAVRKALEINLSKAGFEVRIAQTGEEAIDKLHDAPADVVLTDLKMPGMTGLELLEETRRRWPDTQVVMMTGHGTVERAVEAMRLGAHDFIIKPVSRAELIAILKRALRERSLLQRVEQLEAAATERFGFEKLVGNTPAMQELFEQVSAVADSDALVLLTGPTGTGKELLAHAVHYRSPRRNARLVQVNCGALPSGLLESELFGHERGAFTGAVRQHQGKFEQADGGTLMLDEVGEMPLDTQVKLLRILESGELQRVGGTKTIKVDVRVIAATNRDLREEVREGRFRKDLFYRLDVFRIEVPSLRQRRDDIPLLVNHFIAKQATRHGRAATACTETALQPLLAHTWPGNVRELEHVVERAVILCSGTTIERFRLTSPVEPEGTIDTELIPPGTTIQEVLRDKERELVVAALRAEQGVQARAARRLGVSRANLNYRIQKLGLIIKDIVYE